MIGESLGVERRGVLAASVGMCHKAEVGAGLAGAERHPEGIEDQVGAHVPRELPAHDAATEHVDHEAEEHHTLPASEIAQVADPQAVRLRRREPALHQIRLGGEPADQAAWCATASHAA